MLFLAALCAQPPQEQGKKKGGPPPAPKNLKVLKLEAGQNIGQIMRTYTVALGVKCDHCHVAGNYASDDNPKKEIARMMIGMTQEINGKIPGHEHDHVHVSCFTCHRG